jgi:hypothetical protein
MTFDRLGMLDVALQARSLTIQLEPKHEKPDVRLPYSGKVSQHLLRS